MALRRHVAMPELMSALEAKRASGADPARASGPLSTRYGHKPARHSAAQQAPAAPLMCYCYSRRGPLTDVPNETTRVDHVAGRRGGRGGVAVGGARAAARADAADRRAHQSGR